MSELRREMYPSEVNGASVVFSPFADLPTQPGIPAVNQITILVNTLYSPCEFFTPLASCGRYEVIIRRKS